MHPVILSLHFAAQELFTYFNKTFWHDTTNTITPACKPISDGYLLFGGYIASNNEERLYVRKLDLQGNEMWIKDFDNEQNAELGIIESGKQVIITSDDHIVIAYPKDTFLLTLPRNNIYLTKMDLQGNRVWTHHFGIENRNEIPRQVIQTSDGGYAITGTRGMPNNETGASMYVIKTDSVGQFEWENTYVANFGQAFTIQQTWQDDGYIIGGYGKTDTSGYDMWIVKIAANGAPLWEKNYGSPPGENSGDGAAFVVPITTSQEFANGQPIQYLSLGSRATGLDNSFTLSVAMLDTSGTILWERYDYEYNVAEFVTLPIIFDDGSFLVSPQIAFVNLFFLNPYLTYFSANGDMIWNKKLVIDKNYGIDDGDLATYIRDLQPTPDGGYVLAGYQYSPSPQKGWVLKVDSLGNTCSVENCDSTVVVQGVGVEEPLAITSTIQLSPNPAKDVITIHYQLPDKNGELKLYDVYGREHLQTALPTKQQTQTLNLSTLPTGIYIYQITQANKPIATGKLIKR